jgi:hypothetical protein
MEESRSVVQGDNTDNHVKEIPVTTLKAIAFDPGITTGYAVGIMQNGLMEVRTGQSKWRHIDLYNQLVLGNPDYVIWEKFYFRKHYQKEGVELYPKELIGVLQLYCQQNNKPAFDQNPMKSQGSFHSNLKLKEDGIYVAGQPHGMDALRHLLYWFTFGPGYKFNTKGYKKA